ncbi:hypothetical protein HMN09_01105900 [Mycena chlorophos]|uniref:Uncharacterized protein n=1 Tax=Mycena chlorophos TaxID=658473 RepID=A0A8H6VZU6_MYCCL|nr:hypothetical protein HMN09_01105900 [Mycena chlorophos]
MESPEYSPPRFYFNEYGVQLPLTPPNSNTCVDPASTVLPSSSGSSARSSRSGSGSSRSIPDVPQSITLPEPPLVSVGAHAGRPLPTTPLLPPFPPRDCPIRLEYDEYQRPVRFRQASSRPLRVQHEFVMEISQHRRDPTAPCSHCGASKLHCDFSGGWGPSCPICVILGSDECEFSDRVFFLSNLRAFRDDFLLAERRRAEQNYFSDGAPIEVVRRQYQESVDWFYRAAQGAIDRFELLRATVRPLARRGYRQLAQTCDDTAYLTQCLSDAQTHGLHHGIHHIFASRVAELTAQAML